MALRGRFRSWLKLLLTRRPACQGSPSMHSFGLFFAPFLTALSFLTVDVALVGFCRLEHQGGNGIDNQSSPSLEVNSREI